MSADFAEFDDVPHVNQVYVKGGPVTNEAYVVGEVGPETWLPEVGGYIVPGPIHWPGRRRRLLNRIVGWFGWYWYMNRRGGTHYYR